MDMQKKQTVTFDFDFIQKVANYLSTKPYIEVFEFINQIQTAAQGALGLNAPQDDKKPKPEE